MADELLNGDDDDIFVYTGGDQEVPRDVRRAKIDESIDTIPRGAFSACEQLVEVEGHDKLKKIEEGAFFQCTSLVRLIKMNGVKEIGEQAFFHCSALCEVDFEKLEVIGYGTFNGCKSLKSINLPSVRRVGERAFWLCIALTEAVFGEDLERIEEVAFLECHVLGRIAIPLKDGLVVEDDRVFFRCANLSRVDTVVGGIHKTISSLHMESWRNEMKEGMNRINQELPNTSQYSKTAAIQSWIRSVLRGMEHYKVEHKVLVKEAMTLLELALWKAKLLNEEGKCNHEEEGKKAKKARIGEVSTRKEHRVTCGANIVIKNVLPFLALK